MPRIFAVQSENCCPFSKAVENDSTALPEIITSPTLAEGIAIAEPMRFDEIMGYIRKYRVQVITAPENMISEAQAQLAEQGIFCELTTAATYAAYLHYCKFHGPLTDVLLPMCGAGLKSMH